MASFKQSLQYLTLLSCLHNGALALVEQVLSTVMFVNHGDRVPLALGAEHNLTPLGAQQLYQLGSDMRQRYISPNGSSSASSFPIRDISPIQLVNSEINILTSTDPWVTASSQAFMQGLYPPLTMGQNYSHIYGESEFANGTNILAPLDGYQYPNVESASGYDLRSIFVKGSENCPAYDLAMIEYFNSSAYENIQRRTQDFYNSLQEPLLDGVFDSSSVGYFDAYYIWDYLSYEYIHNATVARKLSTTDYLRAQILADDWMFAMYANSSADGEVGSDAIRAIAGRTLGAYIVDAFFFSIQEQGRYNKMNLIFGDYKPMMSFAALAQLMTERTGAFFSSPAPGASFIFELFTLQSESITTEYPKSSDMYVRFLYQNGTDASASLIEYPLFGASPSQSSMSYVDFVNAMSGITINDVEDWCATCGSGSAFCPVSTSSGDSSREHHGLSPAVAGVIGAMAALAFIALLIAAVMVLGGIRFYRKPSKRQSHLGGFKGSEKLASDQDLTIPKGSAGATIVEEHPRGHERVGSWELKEPGVIPTFGPGPDVEASGQGRFGADHDENAVDHWTTPVKPHDSF